MNERIRELAADAGYPDYMTYGQDKVLERFAELIVRECLMVIDQPNGVGDDDVIRISDDVKKHFGVE